MQKRLDDFLNMGVPNIWISDSVSTQACMFTSNGLSKCVDGILRTTDGAVSVSIAEVVNF